MKLFSITFNSFQIQRNFDDIESLLLQLERSIIDDEVPKSVFIDVGSQPEDRQKERIGVCAERSRKIYKTMRAIKSFCKLVLNSANFNCLLSNSSTF